MRAAWVSEKAWRTLFMMRLAATWVSTPGRLCMVSSASQSSTGSTGTLRVSGCRLVIRASSTWRTWNWQRASETWSTAVCLKLAISRAARPMLWLSMLLLSWARCSRLRKASLVRVWAWN